MQKVIFFILIFFFSINGFSKVKSYEEDYLTAGQNTVQKIYCRTSSNFSSIHKGILAMDSDKKTSWTSKKDNGPHWFEIDFGVKRLMTSMNVVLGEKDNYKTVKRFKLQFKYRNEWFDFFDIDLEKHSEVEGKWEKDGDRIEINLGGVDARQFRIYIPEGATYQGYAAISELETYIGKSKIKYFDYRLKGLAFPIKNGFLPENNSSYPNAPRPYRSGRHVGLDIYTYHAENSYEPIAVSRNTQVCSLDDGVIIRADWDYKPLSAKEWKLKQKYYSSHQQTFDKRSFGGIQVWIDHGNGVISAYNHLSRIKNGIKVGKKVDKGDVIGFVGNSGLLGEAEGKDYGLHLHLEIWVDSHYLGYGMPADEVRKYITWIFFPLQ